MPKTKKEEETSFAGLTLLVSDVERSLDYYSKMPGAVILHKSGDEFAQLKIGKRFRLQLLKSKSKKGFHLEFESTDLDSLYARLVSKKIAEKVPAPPKDRAWGERSFSMTDPDGYEAEFEDGGGEGAA